MAQHFLLSPRARDFALSKLFQMSDHEILDFFSEARWGDSQRPACPCCGVVDRHYFRRTRAQWQCRSCFTFFSVTTGTLFQDRKVSLRILLCAIQQFATSSKGISSVHLAAQIGVNQKVAFVILGKLREAIFRNADLRPLEGMVQIDGVHFCGKPRKPNRRLARMTTEEFRERLSAKKGQTPAMAPKKSFDRHNIRRRKNRRIILVARQTSVQPGKGGERTIVGIALAENEKAALGFVRKAVAPGALTWTDENSAYSQLSKSFAHETVQHSREFVNEDGVNDNQCESFNSRIRRSEYGVFHGYRPKYLADYAWEFVWREDSRRRSPADKVLYLLSLALGSGRSIWWRGYWQRLNRPHEMLFRYGHQQYFLEEPDQPPSVDTNSRHLQLGS